MMLCSLPVFPYGAVKLETITDIPNVRADYWNKVWLCAVCTGLILTAGCANQRDNLSQVSELLDCAKADLVNLPEKIIEDPKESLEHLSETSDFILDSAKASAVGWKTTVISGTKDTFSKKDNVVALLLASGASVAMHASDADKKIADNFDDHHIFHNFTDESLNVIGHPWTQIGASALWYVVSSQKNDELSKQRAKTMVSALTVTGAVTMGLKAVRHNESPNGKDWSWPSGHASSSFAVASMLDEFYGPKVGLPAYGLAGLIAYRMMDTGDHWASDVVFGATLGWVVGHTFAGKGKELEVAGFKVIPVVAGGQGPVAGVSIVKRF